MKFLTAGFRREDLLRIAPGDLPLLAGEVRERIIETVRENGGHLGSSLGAVELTMALLRRFDPLHDRIVFDVGHQVYPYKLLTDRADRFDTLRTGSAAFPAVPRAPATTSTRGTAARPSPRPSATPRRATCWGRTTTSWPSPATPRSSTDWPSRP